MSEEKVLVIETWTREKNGTVGHKVEFVPGHEPTGQTDEEKELLADMIRSMRMDK